MDKDSISWTERVFCSSIIDFIWFVLSASNLNGYCSLMFFNVFYADVLQATNDDAKTSLNNKGCLLWIYAV